MTLTRILTSLVLVPVVVAIVWFAPTWGVAILAAGVMGMALFEYFQLCERTGLLGYTRWTIFCALWLIVAQWAASGADALAGVLSRGGVSYPAPPILDWVLPPEFLFTLFILGAAGISLTGRLPFAAALSGTGVSAGGLLFVALPLSYLVRLHGQASPLPAGIEKFGPKLLLFTLCLVWVGDSLAYFVGRAFGRSQMAPKLSPKKTWEGAAANVAGAALVGAIFARWLGMSFVHLALVAALANIAGQAGDLLESAFKRAAGAKDSGKLLPGHGGVFDRIDSLVFAAPVVWWYFFIVRP